MKIKKILPIAFLAVLLVWGIYDINRKNSANNNVVENSNIDNKSKIDTIMETKIGIEKGDMAPDFELTTLEDKKVKLSDYRGKKVILNFWNTWCPPCKAEIPDMEKFYSTYKDKGMVILGVNLIQGEKGENVVKDFIKSYGITYPVPIDADGSVSNVYQVSSIPTSYIINTQGIITDKAVGPMAFDTLKIIYAITK